MMRWSEIELHKFFVGYLRLPGRKNAQGSTEFPNTNTSARPSSYDAHPSWETSGIIAPLHHHPSANRHHHLQALLPCHQTSNQPAQLPHIH